MPGAAIPGVLAPTIFFLGLTSVFGELTNLRGFTTDSYASFLIPVSLLQGAGFTGAATGVNLARDIELGWFDRLSGLAVAAARAVGRPRLLRFGARARAGRRASERRLRGRGQLAGAPGLLIAFFGVMAMGTVAALYGCWLALKFRTQGAAPLMQAGMFVAILFTTSYAPKALLQPWLQTVSEINPVTQILEMVRQGFVTGGVTWGETWPGLARARRPHRDLRLPRAARNAAHGRRLNGSALLVAVGDPAAVEVVRARARS